MELACVTYATNEGVLAYVTFGVLLESKLWEGLEEQDCKTLTEFYKKVGKHLQIKSSKEALYKSQDPKSGKTEEKKEDKKRERKGRKDKSLKKLRIENNKANNRYISRYMNYTLLNAPIYQIFTVTRDKSIFGKLDVIRQDKSKRDACKFYKFHKDISHDMSRCDLLKDVIKRLIRRGYFCH